MTSAHATFHFFLGAAAGMGLLLPCIWSAARDQRPLSGPLLRWLLVAYGLGLWAVVPNVLGHLGVPQEICDGWWMNAFLLHPLIDRVQDGGKLLGEVGMTMIFCTQYLVLVTSRIQPGKQTVKEELRAFAENTSR